MTSDHKAAIADLGLRVGDPIHLDPRALPKLRIITAEEAKAISANEPERWFTITSIEGDGA